MKAHAHFPPPRPPLTPFRVGLISTGLFLLLLAAILFSLTTGTADVSLGQLMGFLGGDSDPGGTARLIVLKIRLPRILLGALAGFSLALGGVVFQAILGNPLADPFILGVSSGSAFGAVLGIMLGLGFTVGVPVSSFAGALLSIVILLGVGTRRMGMESTTILLTGVIINAFFSAVIMFFIATAADDRLHTMLFWLYGDLSQGRLSQAFIMAPAALAAFGVLYLYAGHLNLITAGEEAALQMGADTRRVKLVCLGLVSLIIGAVVSFSGLIGFVGLMVPHLCRMMFGSDHRLLMPVSALSGAVFLVLADTVSRTIVSPAELPVGVITAFLGAPFFVYLLRKRGSRWNGS